MSGESIEAKIQEALKDAPKGMRQIAISDAAGAGYRSVLNWLKGNFARFKLNGK